MTADERALPAFEARPIRLLWLVVPPYAGALIFGLVESGGWLPNTAARVLWVTVCAATLAYLAVPLLRAQLTLSSDGILTKRVIRTHRVDLNDLVGLHARGDHPWLLNMQGVIGFEDSRGGLVEVALPGGVWATKQPMWTTLVEVIEASNLPLPGIIVGQLERYLLRPVETVDANRRAVQDGRSAIRNGRATPHRVRGGAPATARLLLLPLIGALATWAAGEGLVPDDQAALWQLILGAATLATLALALLLPRRSMQLTEDATLVSRGPGRRDQIDLTRLTTVELRPDEPYLERTTSGHHTATGKPPTLRLRDEAGEHLKIQLGNQWTNSGPVLRHVLAAAEERGVALSDHARYELEFRCGLLRGPEWIGVDPNRRAP